MLQRVEWLEFVDYAEKSKGIICIGAGRGLQTLIHIFPSSISAKIKYVMDNDMGK